MKTLEQMAEEAGFQQAMGASHVGVAPYPETLQRFAALVAERCAEIIDRAGGNRHVAAAAILAEFPKP